MTRATLMCLAAFAAAMLSACERREISGPPAIRLGLDGCVACGMLVMEDRCSCALLIVSDGSRKHLVFDDLGCLLDYQADNPEPMILETFVHDYGTATWISGESAHYLCGVSHTLSTPMGSGIVAFESVDDAHAQKQISGGENTTLKQAAEIRRNWREKRRTQSMETR